MLSVKVQMDVATHLMDRGIEDTAEWINTHTDEECSKLVKSGFVNSYMIVEDTGSGYQFWDNVVQAKYNRRHGVLHLVDDFHFQSGGVDHVNAALMYLLRDINNLVNRYYIICDEVTDLSGSAKKARDNVHYLCTLYPQTFISIPNCLCFESIVLSYRGISRWILLQNENKVIDERILSQVQDALYTDLNLVMQLTPDNMNTETWLASILYELTADTKLKIIKKQLSTCWKSSCCFSPYAACGLSERLGKLSKCLEAFTNSYIAALLDEVIL